MNDPKKAVLAAGLNGMLSSYDGNNKELCRSYIKDNLVETAEIMDVLSPTVMIEFVKIHKASLKAWAQSEAEKESSK